MRSCKACGAEKSLGDFHPGRAICKLCQAARLRADRKTNPEKHRKYEATKKARHREKILARDRARWQKRKDDYNAQRKADRAENPDEVRAQQRAWRDANRDRALEVQRKSYAKHRDKLVVARREAREVDPERFRAYERTKRERHADKIRERQLAYYAANPERFEIARAKRKAREAGVEHKPYTRREIFERDEGRCRVCRKELILEPRGFQIDHIVPISLGGPDTPANVQLMCPKCNRAKWANLEGQIHLPV